MTLAAGDMLTDNLLLERELGSGGMGVVWLAKNCALGTQVAVKVLHVGGGPNRTRRERFEREARGLAQLEHPNLVRLFDYGMTPDGEPFIVMELLRGEDLAQRLERVGRLDLATTSAILAQACRGLGRAHEAGVVHRDIKPANLFLSGEGAELVVKVLDFGVARFGEDQVGSGMTRTGVLVGTPSFMSPEQLVAPKTVDQRTDLWALGIVAYGALTGRLPYEGETVASIGIAVMQGARPPIRSVRPDLPPAIDAWVERALAKEPNQRFQSARELAEGLAQVASGASFAQVASGAGLAQPAAPAVAGPPPSFAPVSAAPASMTAAAIAAPVLAGPAIAAPTPKRSKAPLIAIGVVVAGVLGLGGWIAVRRAARSTETEAAEATAAPTATPKKPKTAAPMPSALASLMKDLANGGPKIPILTLPSSFATKARPFGDLGDFTAPNMKRVEPITLYERAEQEARKIHPSAAFTSIFVTGGDGGTVDLTGPMKQIMFQYEVLVRTGSDTVQGSFSIAFREGTVSKFPPGALGGTAVRLGGGDPPLPAPKCSFERAWRGAVEHGAPPNSQSSMGYYRSRGIGAWHFTTVDDVKTRFDGATCALLSDKK